MNSIRRYYSISELGRDFGLSRSTLLYYDRIGILSPAARSSNGYRRYGQADHERLQRICRYRELGLSLGDIREALSTGKRPSVKVLKQRLAEVERQMASLESHKRLLNGMLQRLASESSRARVDKDLWVEMLRVAGMDDAAMFRWHVEFEKRAPEGHASFLESLGIPEDEVARIRKWSQSGKREGE